MGPISLIVNLMTRHCMSMLNLIICRTLSKKYPLLSKNGYAIFRQVKKFLKKRQCITNNHLRSVDITTFYRIILLRQITLTPEEDHGIEILLGLIRHLALMFPQMSVSTFSLYLKSISQLIINLESSSTKIT